MLVWCETENVVLRMTTSAGSMGKAGVSEDDSPCRPHCPRPTGVRHSGLEMKGSPTTARVSLFLSGELRDPWVRHA